MSSGFGGFDIGLPVVRGLSECYGERVWCKESRMFPLWLGKGPGVIKLQKNSLKGALPGSVIRNVIPSLSLLLQSLDRRALRLLLLRWLIRGPYSRSSLDEKLVKNIQDTYSINSLRTIEQDAGFGIRQIVDIALKALSPGVNDTTTAVTCIDYLTAINLRLAIGASRMRWFSKTAGCASS